MRTLTCPVCSRQIVRRRVGIGWNVLPVHSRPTSEHQCSGSGAVEVKKRKVCLKGTR